jgi:predicted transcriptional regulator
MKGGILMLVSYGDKKERLDLFLELKRKGLRMTHIAKELNCSASLLSKYFDKKCNISLDKEIKLKEIINKAKEYKWIKVEA